MTTHHAPKYPDMVPWYDLVDWTAVPHLAYAKGLADGYELGRQAADAAMVAALAEALGGAGCTDYRQAVRRHERTLAALARRRRFDTGQAA